MTFKPPAPTPAGLWRRTPPAIFPPIMGLFGLGLAWRRAADTLAVTYGPAEAIIGAVTLLFLFAFLAYLVKTARRPAVVLEDLRILPGRAGIGAMVLCFYLMSIALEPYGTAVARAIFFGGLGLHTLLVLVLIYRLATGPAEQRRVTPVWHLNFVGFIIGALAAIQFGYYLLCLSLFTITLFIAAFIWAASADQGLRETVPAPLRPLLAIHLAPAALLGLVAGAMGLTTAAQFFAAIAAAILLWLVIRARWLTAAGFSPLWGAFTFPLAAAASLWLTLGGVWLWPGIGALVAATLMIPAITFRVLRLWARGQLAIKTNAAIA